MANVSVDFKREIGKIKIMHAVNNGPSKPRDDQSRGNFKAYKALHIPYARNHDAAFCATYGGHHTVDVNFIFPNFDADVNDPASYDFACTDKYVRETHEAGTETFYRLGSKIEHEVKKYNTLPPKDFKKWAEICEHIIRHYTRGWADGFHYKMTYWEIWNEPDLDPDDAENKRTWGGTELQFYDFYEVAAKHLKSRFPRLKIGGPSCAGRLDWTERFLTEMKRREVPIDFYSWHGYNYSTDAIVEKMAKMRSIIDSCGYPEAQSIYNEFNYVKDWSGSDFIYSIRQIHGIKGAAFYADLMLKSQRAPVDMLMYYDARVATVWNGLFDYYDLSPLKGYYALKMFSKLYILGTECELSSDDEAISAVAAVGKGGKRGVMLCYYTDDDSTKEIKSVVVDLGVEKDKAIVSIVDKRKSGRGKTYELKDGKLEIKLSPNSFAYIAV